MSEATTNSNLEFRKIPSLNYLYEVNSNGTIFRNAKSKQQLKIKLDMHHSDKGYYHVWICRDHKVRRIPIARVVAECWLGPKPEGLQIDHIDRNSHNNDYRNLRYVTHSEQMKNRKLSLKFLETATANCLKYSREVLSKPIKLIAADGTEYQFPSKAQAAAFLAKDSGCTVGTITSYLTKERSHIHGYDVVYLRNAETGHGDSTE